MNTLLDVKAKVRALVGDPDGDFCTDAYLLPLINQAYEQATLYLENSCSPATEKLVDLPGIPAGTTTFGDLQVSGKPLAGLETPLQLEWKLNGQSESCYDFAKEVPILPNITPSQYTPLRGVFWEWRASKLYVTPLAFIVDFRLRGDFSPIPLAQDAQDLGIHPKMATGVGYAAAALVGGERVNATYMQNWGAQAITIFDDISASLVRQQQGVSVRIGRMSGSRRRGYR